DAKRQKLSASFVDKVELQSVTTLAWPTATYDPTTGASMSYVALCGKRLSTVWRYEHNYAGTDGLFTSRLDESPVATAVTGVYGWPTCSAWMLMETDAIVVGTSSGNVLMMRLTRQEAAAAGWRWRWSAYCGRRKVPKPELQYFNFSAPDNGTMFILLSMFIAFEYVLAASALDAMVVETPSENLLQCAAASRIQTAIYVVRSLAGILA
ncbi:hypothetical protein DYB37_013624, partial [Aphanomyces astaci]